MGYQSDWHASLLERTYLPILHQLAKNAFSRKTLGTKFRPIVGTIINLANPLSVPSPSKLLAISENKMNARLKSLHSVVDMPTQANPHAPVRMFHLSFRDFLSDRLYDNHDLDGFWIDEREAHRVIHKKCFELMSSPEGLRRDICNLKAPGMLRVDMDAKLIEQHLVPKLQYVCCYWVYRLQQSADDNGPADELLRKHTFHKVNFLFIVFIRNTY